MSEHRWFRPLREWLVSYRADWLRPDIVAGLTTGAVIIPKAMAYAMMAGLPVQVSLHPGCCLLYAPPFRLPFERFERSNTQLRTVQVKDPNGNS